MQDGGWKRPQKSQGNRCQGNKNENALSHSPDHHSLDFGFLPQGAKSTQRRPSLNRANAGLSETIRLGLKSRWLHQLGSPDLLCHRAVLTRIFHTACVARATRPCRRGPGPAEAGLRLLARAMRWNFSPSLAVPVGESPTGTGESPVLPNQNGARYEISALEQPCPRSAIRDPQLAIRNGISPWPWRRWRFRGVPW
jgi:hypothetical protein